MYLTLALIPISAGIICYLIKSKYKNIPVYISFIYNFFIIMSSKPGNFTPGNYDFIRGIEFVFNAEIRILLLSVLLFFILIFFRVKDIYKKEFNLFFLVLYGSINSFFMSRDFFNIYVHIELISIIIFLLIAMDRNTKRIWASMKYMFMSTIALQFYLIGVGIIYMKSGTLNLPYNLEKGIDTIPYILITFSLLIKSGGILLSGWLPDAHSEAIKGISPLLSGLIVKIGLYTIYLISPSIDTKINNIIIYYSLITATISSIFTLFEDDIKKMLAFSTMTNMSYGLLIILINKDLFIYFIIYHMFSKGILFFIFEDIYEKEKTKSLTKLNGSFISIDIYILMIILFMSLSGVYPSMFYFIKKSLPNFLFLNINVLISGMYMIKVLKKFKIKKDINFKYIINYIVMFFLTYIYSNKIFEYKSIEISPYIYFFVGTILYIILEKICNKKIISFEKKFRNIKFFTLENSLLYQLIFLVIIMSLKYI
ncbi:multisubunit sodium/proton antiporter MrpD subunit [Oceanotoga teriensis]|uniref:Multisubunit sodium/proton antiporter MrpD subunit n=1 Tax=Oceanotoga teriensis TaxID=515440 RepID=A0AA45C4U1_9BACT|nr:proton-conducting transporter membrane subunit [Oceanotoga teriensis]PWJ87151.1 multisubunit sodium/proton antiporter MrpD subunit [Oceanotoga teriensis]